MVLRTSVFRSTIFPNKYISVTIGWIISKHSGQKTNKLAIADFTNGGWNKMLPLLDQSERFSAATSKVHFLANNSPPRGNNVLKLIETLVSVMETHRVSYSGNETFMSNKYKYRITECGACIATSPTFGKHRLNVCFKNVCHTLRLRVSVECVCITSWCTLTPQPGDQSPYSQRLLS